MASSLSSAVVKFFVAASCCLVGFQAQSASLDAGDQRMLATAKLWRDVKWLSPGLTRGEVDWDLALVRSLPKIQAARGPDELKQALAGLMEPLHDPAFTLAPGIAAGPVNFDPSRPMLEWLDGDIALLHLHANSPRPSEVAVAMFQLRKRAKALVVDLRLASTGAYAPIDLNALAANLIDQPLWVPAQRGRAHHGYESQSRPTGGYYSALETMETTRLLPAPGARPMPTVFVVNNNPMRRVPPALLALQRAGKAFIVSQGPMTISSVLHPAAARFEANITVPYSVNELVFEDGSSGVGADAIAPIDPGTDGDSSAVKAALGLLRSGLTPGARVAYRHLPTLAVKQVESLYTDMAYPDLAWRQLAVFKLWAVADAFFPYKQHLDAPWDDALPEFLKKVAAARNAREYVLALAEMGYRLGDNHVLVTNPEMRKALGVYTPGIYIARADGRIAVAGFSGEQARIASGLKVGDVIVSVDGEDAVLRLARLGELAGGSRLEMKLQRAQVHFLAAEEKIDATLLVEDAGGARREVRVARDGSLPYRQRSGPVVQVLAGNVGYVDLDRLESSGIDAMFDQVAVTRALILDMRGYPHGVWMALVPRLNVKGAQAGAQTSDPLVTVAGGYSARATLQQVFYKTDKPLYKGQLVMLLDERSQSQAEHTAIFVEAAAPVTFIGSRTSGADGDVTYLNLPGNVIMSFTGREVRHADGRQLQRIGIAPHIAVAPTLKGLREGRDEVLERAQTFIADGK